MRCVAAILKKVQPLIRGANWENPAVLLTMRRLFVDTAMGNTPITKGIGQSQLPEFRLKAILELDSHEPGSIVSAFPAIIIIIIIIIIIRQNTRSIYTL